MASDVSAECSIEERDTDGPEAVAGADDAVGVPATGDEMIPCLFIRDKEPLNLQTIGEIHVLVIDDEPMICRAIQTALARPEFIIDAVSDAVAIEARLRGKHYHVIILDYVIPGVPFERIQGWLHELQPQAGIIVVTGHPSIDSALNCLRARTFDYLTKPFKISDLETAVMNCLESKGLLRLTKEALRKALGAAVRERRKAQGLTLAELSRRSSVSAGSLSQIELGKHHASVETLYRISLGLGIKLADLFQAVQMHW